MSTNGERIIALSMGVPDLVRGLCFDLDSLAGTPVNLVLVVGLGESVQYMSNAPRAEGMGLLEVVLDAWRTNTLVVSTPDEFEDDPFRR